MINFFQPMTRRKVNSIFKTPKHRSFDYKPLYYKEEEEEMKKRIKFIKLDKKNNSQQNSSDTNQSTISFDRNYQSEQIKRHFVIRLTVTLVLILLITLAILFA